MEDFGPYSFFASVVNAAQHFWPSIKSLFNSSFITALVGSLAGAYAGAWGAQKIAVKAKYKEDALTQIRSINAAISTSYSIMNAFLAMKKQHIQALKVDFDRTKRLIERQRQGEVKRLEYTANLLTFPNIHPPVSILQSLVFEKISSPARARVLTLQIRESIEFLNASISARNNLVEKFKTINFYKEHLTDLYFGYPLDTIHDTSMPSLIEAIYNQVDDVIFFSLLLCKDLNQCGEKIKNNLDQRLQKICPKVEDVDYSKPASEGLLPSKELYADWLKGFKNE